MHNIRPRPAVLKPGGAMPRLIGFTGHFDPEVHAAMLKAYDKWDTVMMPVTRPITRT